MGLKYASGESDALISGLTTNLNSAYSTIESLKSGSQQLTDAIDGNTLSGAAYTAGKGLFQELIIPTITRVTEAVDDVQSDLSKYSSANEIVSDESLLDEANLKQQIEIKKASKAAVDAASYSIRLQSISNPIVKLADALFDAQNRLNGISDDLQDGIDKLQEKLDKLHEFSSAVSGLFSDSLNNFKIAMQGVTILNDITVNSDGTYSLPEGTDKSWFTDKKSKKELEKYKKKQDKLLAETMKSLSDLYTKNPSAVIGKIKNDPKLFNYLITVLDKCPTGMQDAILDVFITKENWDQIPKTAVLELLTNPKFAKYLDKLSTKKQSIVYKRLVKISDKGWDVLAPLGYITSVLSKSEKGAKVIAGAKSGLTAFKKLDKISNYLKEHPMVKESIAYGADGLTVWANAYEEYTDPDSPAYGNKSKSLYGGINKFMIEAGPLEGAEYGGPVGALAGTVNTAYQMGKNAINEIPKKFGIDDGMGWSTSKEDKERWMNEQYKEYDKRQKELESGDYSSYRVPNSEYKPGVATPGGSPSFNPGTS